MNLYDAAAWLEDSPLGHLMRDTRVWTYGVVNLAHILGVATLFGAILILDLRLLGYWPMVPLAALSRPTVTLAVARFVVAAVTGSGLLATKTTECVGNPFLYIKFPAIALGLLNVLLIHRSRAWKAHTAPDLSAQERFAIGAYRWNLPRMLADRHQPWPYDRLLVSREPDVIPSRSRSWTIDGAAMTAMLCWNKVRDFAKWKRIFDAHAPDHEEAGLTLTHMWREVEDPSEVYMLFDVKDINKAKAFLNSSSMPKRQEEAGVVDGPDVHFLEGGRPMH